MQPPAGARTVHVPAARLERWLTGFTERHGATETTTSDDTVALRGADGAHAWIDIPFPPLAGKLLDHATRQRRIGVLLVRRGGYGVGVFDGPKLVSSKVGSSYVQGTTKAGGWSQQRYARRRANQASAAFAGAADAAVRILVPEPPATAPLDALVAGGDRAAVRAVLDDRRLTHLDALLTGPWLNVKDPRLRILQATPEQFLALRITLDP